nr:hypothetical protein GCM10020063_003340 [Dactylosporangium thailandense]
MDSTRLRVSGLTRCGAENVRDTVETWTPEARATSRIVAGTWSPLGAAAAVARPGAAGVLTVRGRGDLGHRSGANYANVCSRVNAPQCDHIDGIDRASASCA